MITGDPAGLAAKGATSTIPIVITNAVDPVGAGLVTSLARPGGNVTGLSGLAVELNTKRLEILKDAVPKLARVALLHPSASLQPKELRPAAQALKLKLEEIRTSIRRQRFRERLNRTQTGYTSVTAAGSAVIKRSPTP